MIKTSLSKYGLVNIFIESECKEARMVYIQEPESSIFYDIGDVTCEKTELIHLF